MKSGSPGRRRAEAALCRAAKAEGFALPVGNGKVPRCAKRDRGKVTEGLIKKTTLMNSLILRVVISLLVGAWVAADAAPQPQSRGAVPPTRNLAVGNEADYALTLRDPFSPIGYRLPMPEWQTSAAVSNVPPPSGDLKAKAKALLRVSGIVKRGNTYVANVNGAIVQVGDEVGVTVDGRTVVFVIRAISLQRVEIEPRE